MNWRWQKTQRVTNFNILSVFGKRMGGRGTTPYLFGGFFLQLQQKVRGILQRVITIPNLVTQILRKDGL